MSSSRDCLGIGDAQRTVSRQSINLMNIPRGASQNKSDLVRLKTDLSGEPKKIELVSRGEAFLTGQRSVQLLFINSKTLVRVFLEGDRS